MPCEKECTSDPCESCKRIMTALGLTTLKGTQFQDEVGDNTHLTGDFSLLYKHEKEKHVIYLNRMDCIKAMKRCKSPRFAGKGDGGKWVLLELYDYEKELLHKEMMIEANVNRYKYKQK